MRESDSGSSLGDDPQSPRYIETLPRKGYDFGAPVTEAGGEPAKVQSAPEPLAVHKPVLARGWWLLSAGAAMSRVAIALAAKMGVSAASRDETDRVADPLVDESHDPFRIDGQDGDSRPAPCRSLARSQ